MSNKLRQKAGGSFVLAIVLVVLSGILVGCNNGGSPALGDATPKPPPSNVDPVTGKARTESTAPTSPRGPGR
ncbi:MAG: hypothetical protein QM758_06530 [Armatimonas sp.]